MTSQVALNVKWVIAECEVNVRLNIINFMIHNGAFTLEVKSVLNENLGGILGGTQC